VQLPLGVPVHHLLGYDYSHEPILKELRMPEQQSDPFSAGGTFVANPRLYDYIHKLVFEPSGAIKMVDGAGQVLNTLVRGRFSIETLGPAEFRVNFTDLVELNPYYTIDRLRGLDPDARFKVMQEDVPYEDRDVRNRPAPFSGCVTREEGLFLFKRQVVWKILDEQDWPHLLYRVRYRFAFDPLEPYAANRQRNAYYRLEAPEPDTRFYYRVADGQKLTAREVAEAGIPCEEGLL
jgi:hypothetical protein